MKLGKNTETEENVNIDLTKLISTRMLIQANSGGGKSWAIRRLLEQSYGQVQQIVIDLEGEFSTLREKYDYLLVGKEGEIPANIKTAELLARKLLKLNVSTIIDLSELKHPERILFVKRFLDSLINAPRELWHACLVIVDEAHQFCPEKVKSESGSSVIDLLTRGRKRGFCGVLATQRIAKLNKDAAAECTNGMVGRTVMDIDRKRASYDLGFSSKEQELSLKKMEDGEFFGYGPAFSKEDYVKFIVGGINTAHPEPGKSILKPSQTPDNIKKLLKDVIDLPKEAESELKTKQEFIKKINELKRDLSVAQHAQPKPLIKVDEKGLERARQQGFKEAEIQNKKQLQVLNNTNKSIEKVLNNYKNHLKQFTINSSKLLQIETPKINELPKFNPKPIQREPQIQRPVTNREQIVTEELDGEIKLSPAYIRLLKASSMFYPEEITKEKMAILADVPRRASTFRCGLSSLKTQGLIIVSDGSVRTTERGLEIAGDVEQVPTDTDGLVNMWCSKLSPAYEKMFRCIIEKYPESISKEDLAYESGVPREASTFRCGLSKIKTLGLIKVESGIVSASPELFE